MNFPKIKFNFRKKLGIIFGVFLAFCLIANTNSNFIKGKLINFNCFVELKLKHYENITCGYPILEHDTPRGIYGLIQDLLVKEECDFKNNPLIKSFPEIFSGDAVTNSISNHKFTNIKKLECAASLGDYGASYELFLISQYKVSKSNNICFPNLNGVFSGTNNKENWYCIWNSDYKNYISKEVKNAPSFELSWNIFYSKINYWAKLFKNNKFILGKICGNYSNHPNTSCGLSEIWIFRYKYLKNQPNPNLTEMAVALNFYEAITGSKLVIE